jgi:hypothetical protein
MSKLNRFISGLVLVALSWSVNASLGAICGYFANSPDGTPEAPGIPPSSLVHLFFWDQVDEEYQFMVFNTSFDVLDAVSIPGNIVLTEPDNDMWVAYPVAPPGIGHLVVGSTTLFKLQFIGRIITVFHPASPQVCEKDT